MQACELRIYHLKSQLNYSISLFGGILNEVGC